MLLRSASVLPALLLASAASRHTNAEATLTVCTGNRCWRNGAGRLLAEVQQHTPARSVGCSGVCPRGAVSVCEGPECLGEALALPASDMHQAASSARLAAAMIVRHQRVARGTSRFPPIRACAIEELERVKGRLIEAIAARSNSAKIDTLVSALEPLCETDRCATSPLLDGYWDVIYASNVPQWAQQAYRKGRLQHAIEMQWSSGYSTFQPSSASPPVVSSPSESVALTADGADDVPSDGDEASECAEASAKAPDERHTPWRAISPASPGLRSGPRGNAWNDVEGELGCERCLPPRPTCLAHTSLMSSRCISRSEVRRSTLSPLEAQAAEALMCSARAAGGARRSGGLCTLG